MAKFGFGCRFYERKYFEVEIFNTFLQFIIRSRALFQEFVEKNLYYYISSCFKQISNNYVFNISTCTLQAPFVKICRLFLKTNCQHKLLGFVDQCVSKMFMILSFKKFKVII